ncbi:hypothetical protein AVEN_204164-1 [Araneus ventricosus]|uniref:Uncharacterized protein n=1 Tax=Araneus ventricosus TaxID=182803 RepID=A0A4Y2NL84_ARAVE|nr:hypothetical protein AVEN_204164-1 [Araneus ventricosus]
MEPKWVEGSKDTYLTASDKLIGQKYFSPALIKIFTNRAMQNVGYFGPDLLILNCGQMTRTKPFLPPNFHATPTGGRLTLNVMFDEHLGLLLGESSSESGFKPANLQSRSRDLTRRPS